MVRVLEFVVLKQENHNSNPMRASAALEPRNWIHSSEKKKDGVHIYEG